MSSSPESKKTSQNPSNTGATPAAHSSAAPAAQPAPAKPATAPAATAAAKPAASSTTHPTSNNNQSNVQFKTANIGQWAAKQENPFAEQNRRADAKRQQAAKTRRKVLPIVAIVGGIIAIGLITWGVILLINSLRPVNTLPEDLSLGDEGAAEIQTTAQNIFNKYLNSNKNSSDNDSDGNNSDDDSDDSESVEQGIEAVSSYFNEQIASTNNNSAKADLVLIEMDLMMRNEQPASVITASKKIDAAVMNDVQRSQFYGMLMNASYGVGDFSSGDYYLNLLDQLPSEENVEG